MSFSSKANINWSSSPATTPSRLGSPTARGSKVYKAPLLLIGPFVIAVALSGAIIRDCHEIYTSNGPTQVTDIVIHTSDGKVTLVQVYGSLKAKMLSHAIKDAANNWERLSTVMFSDGEYMKMKIVFEPMDENGCYPTGFATVKSPNSYQSQQGIFEVITLYGPGVPGFSADALHVDALPIGDLDDGSCLSWPKRVFGQGLGMTEEAFIAAYDERMTRRLQSAASGESTRTPPRKPAANVTVTAAPQTPAALVASEDAPMTYSKPAASSTGKPLGLTDDATIAGVSIVTPAAATTHLPLGSDTDDVNDASDEAVKVTHMSATSGSPKRLKSNNGKTATAADSDDDIFVKEETIKSVTKTQRGQPPSKLVLSDDEDDASVASPPKAKAKRTPKPTAKKSAISTGDADEVEL